MYLSFETQWVVTVNKYYTHGIRSLSLGYFLIYCLLTPNFLDAVPWGEAGLGGGAEAGATCSRPKQLPWMGHSRAGNTSNLNKIQSKN